MSAAMASMLFQMTCCSPVEAAWLDHHVHHLRRSSQNCTLHFRNSKCGSSPSTFVISANCQSRVLCPLLSGNLEGARGDREPNGSWVSAVGTPGVRGRSDGKVLETLEDLGEDRSGVVASEQNNALWGERNGMLGDKLEIPELGTGEDGFWSVVIPTYNRLPILTKCLQALEEQIGFQFGGVDRFEVILVDDGSTDGTVEFLMSEGDAGSKPLIANEAANTWRREQAEDLDRGTRSCQGEIRESCAKQSRRFPHVKLVEQNHAGATTARNLGLKHARGAVIVFIDSDLVVTRCFLRAHGEALREALLEDGDDRAFTYGCVVNTSNFQNPQSEKVKITDYSAAFFATGNVAISRRRLLEAGKLLGPDSDGPFDELFSEYGWEDLELGVRLKQCGARIKHAPDAVGYHWHPAFSVDQLPQLIEQEKQRGRNGARFYQKHPNLNVQLMIQMTPFHELLWFLLTLGGLLNERTLEPILRHLEMKDMNQIAAALVSPILNWHTVQAVKEEAKKLKLI